MINLEGTPLESYNDEYTKSFNALASVTKGSMDFPKMVLMSSIFTFFKLVVDWVQKNQAPEPLVFKDDDGNEHVVGTGALLPNPFDLDSRVRI